ncbi:hypothetical protein NPS01_34930 [Nocardioides psychrotolerans]|uniref:DUF3352 domain-containing protein n=1 Tax=Nocardioides psychrotolerans TaxID=1005945 RepID=A0A1I3NBX3_9ACTN|nr:hypothetical protein [Nocardioides psychrotolerans]GEP39830.1 hypothetical protein NPS01_34930 [Nocardioides psychrotolerans]SFJ06400.1 hypothetical protein SAMN05216561_11773 [Nocardioides psychrotolerans]
MTPLRLRKIGIVLVVVALVAGLAVVGLRWWADRDRTDLQRAIDLAPGDGERFSWTDWGAVRDELGFDLDADSPSEEVTDFLDASYSADLSSTSALPESAQVLHVQFGFSPASADWELFSQSAAGAVVLLHLPEDTDWDRIRARITNLGFVEPADEAGVWEGGSDVLGRIGSGITPEVGYIALDEEDSLVFTSDTRDYLAEAVDDAIGDGSSVSGLSEVVDASGSPLSAAIYTGPQACGALAMGQADPDDQAQGEQLVREAGEVNPYTGFAMSVQPGLDLRVALSFETDEQARTNADTRAVLAAGPAPGQGGDFSDRFALGPVEADGPVVTLALEPVEGSYVLSDLSNGPVLFATC